MGRGAVNQKGPEATFLAALHAIRAAGRKLPVNVVLVCEGEEEIGSPHFRQIATKPNILAALKKCEGIFIPFASQGKTGNVTVNLRSEEHTSELQSLMRISYAVFCLKKKNNKHNIHVHTS